MGRGNPAPGAEFYGDPKRLVLRPAGKLSDEIGGVPKVEYHEQGGLLDVAVDPEAWVALITEASAKAFERQPPLLFSRG
jgi:hypothetical protein